MHFLEGLCVKILANTLLNNIVKQMLMGVVFREIPVLVREFLCIFLNQCKQNYVDALSM